MRIRPLLFYLSAKYREDFIQNQKVTYQTDIIISILKQLRGESKVKLWSEIESNFYNKVEPDNRTSKQIEEEVLNKFKNWGS